MVVVLDLRDRPDQQVALAGQLRLALLLVEALVLATARLGLERAGVAVAVATLLVADALIEAAADALVVAQLAAAEIHAGIPYPLREDRAELALAAAAE